MIKMLQSLLLSSLLVLASRKCLVVEAGHVRGLGGEESSSYASSSQKMKMMGMMMSSSSSKTKEKIPATDPPAEIVPLDSFPQWQAEVGYWIGEYSCECVRVIG